MKPIKSKRHPLSVQVPTGLGVGIEHERDLDAHSNPLDADDLSEVAAYGKTGTCVDHRRDLN